MSSPPAAADGGRTITVATQDGVDMRFNSQELIQSVANDGAFDAIDINPLIVLPKGKGVRIADALIVPAKSHK